MKVKIVAFAMLLSAAVVQAQTTSPFAQGVVGSDDSISFVDTINFSTDVNLGDFGGGDSSSFQLIQVDFSRGGLNGGNENGAPSAPADFGLQGFQSESFAVTPIPEPTTLSLGITASVLIGMFSANRKCRNVSE